MYRLIPSSITKPLNDVVKNKRVLLVGGSDNINCDALQSWLLRSKKSPTMVHINNHFWRRKLFDSPIAKLARYIDVLVHTVVAPIPLLGDNLRDVCELAYLNLVDVDNERGSRSTPLWLEQVNRLKELQARTQGVAYPKISFFASGEWAGQNPYGPEHEWLNVLHRQYNTKLLTGMVAFALILGTECSEIYVCGMDFYKDKTKAVAKSRVESHDLEGNLDFFVDNVGSSRVILDPEVQEALKQYGKLERVYS